MYVSLDVLNAIARRDPDGSSLTPPTDEQYAAHKAWAIETYGADAWREYVGESWAPMSDV